MAVDRKRIWEGSIESDTTASKPFLLSHQRKFYDVRLYDNNTGKCTCEDWERRGFDRGNLEYACKHIRQARAQYVPPAPAIVASVFLTDRRVVDVYKGANNSLSLRAIDSGSGVLQRAAMISETETAEAFAEARRQMSFPTMSNSIRNMGR